MKPVQRDSPNDGVGLTWDNGTPLTTSEGKAWWAGWEEGHTDGSADMQDVMREEIDRLRNALWLIDNDANSLYDAVQIARAALGEGK